VHLDAIKTGADRVGGTAAEVLDDAGDLVEFERTRLGGIDEGTADIRLGLGADRGRGNRPLG
jgi:hypothetical protein